MREKKQNSLDLTCDLLEFFQRTFLSLTKIDLASQKIGEIDKAEERVVYTHRDTYTSIRVC